MEYVSGGELFDYIVSKGRLPPDEARSFIHQVCAYIAVCACCIIVYIIIYIDYIWN